MLLLRPPRGIVQGDGDKSIPSFESHSEGECCGHCRRTWSGSTGTWRATTPPPSPKTKRRLKLPTMQMPLASSSVQSLIIIAWTESIDKLNLRFQESLRLRHEWNLATDNTAIIFRSQSVFIWTPPRMTLTALDALNEVWTWSPFKTCSESQWRTHRHNDSPSS